MGSTISSMTGFARMEGAQDTMRWVWELKCVNGRGLEIRSRLPQGFDSLEPEIRKAARAKLNRGSMNVSLVMQAESSEPRYGLNMPALDAAIDAIKVIGSRVECDPPRADGILALRGVMQAVEENKSEADREPLVKALLASFSEAVDMLVAARATEGAVLAAIFTEQFDEIERLTRDAAASAAAAPEALRAKLTAQIEELLSGSALPEERLAQEVAILAVKADVREELDRLVSHIEAGRALLKLKGPAGRQLDFLTQEFNREANTLCSKASDMTLKRIGLELKKVIDQLREQVQNIE